jgi:hypothetical protein
MIGCCLSSLLDDGLKRFQSVGQRGRPRLQNDRRLHFVQRAVPHGGYLLETGSGGEPLGTEFLAAPRADDDVGSAGDALLCRNDPLLCRLSG